MKLLTEVEAGERVTVKKIEGGTDLKGNLGDLGIAEGATVNIVGMDVADTSPKRGTYARADVNGQSVTIGYGMAKKVWVE